jgi:hypothetical protein
LIGPLKRCPSSRKTILEGWKLEEFVRLRNEAILSGKPLKLLARLLTRHGSSGQTPLTGVFH